MIAAGTRREMLASFAGALALPSVATVPSRIPAPDPLDAIRRTADLLAAMMQELHGGTWYATVDNDSGFVLVRPRLSETTQADLRKAGAS